MRIVFPQDGGIYQQDIAECHTTDSVRAWFKEHQDQFIVLPCPENSPDLSPINNLWNPLDRVVRVMDPHARLPVVGREGEIVITVPTPTLPIYLWKDENNETLKKMYLTKYPGFWSQHDVCYINPHTKGMMLKGRSSEVQAVGSQVVQASDSRLEGLGSMPDASKYLPCTHGVSARYISGSESLLGGLS
ncbi:acetoacetyl-CoA synthetase [Trichonephila clavipes]|nr:acetoacetyl-CoA synthetase [Trichonephila clavipes]